MPPGPEASTSSTSPAGLSRQGPGRCGAHDPLGAARAAARAQAGLLALALAAWLAARAWRLLRLPTVRVGARLLPPDPTGPNRSGAFATFRTLELRGRLRGLRCRLGPGRARVGEAAVAWRPFRRGAALRFSVHVCPAAPGPPGEPAAAAFRAARVEGEVRLARGAVEGYAVAVRLLGAARAWSSGDGPGDESARVRVCAPAGCWATATGGGGKHTVRVDCPKVRLVYRDAGGSVAVRAEGVAARAFVAGRSPLRLADFWRHPAATLKEALLAAGAPGGARVHLTAKRVRAASRGPPGAAGDDEDARRRHATIGATLSGVSLAGAPGRAGLLKLQARHALGHFGRGRGGAAGSGGVARARSHVLVRRAVLQIPGEGSGAAGAYAYALAGASASAAVGPGVYEDALCVAGHLADAWARAQGLPAAATAAWSMALTCPWVEFALENPTLRSQHGLLRALDRLDGSLQGVALHYRAGPGSQHSMSLAASDGAVFQQGRDGWVPLVAFGGEAAGAGGAGDDAALSYVTRAADESATTESCFTLDGAALLWPYFHHLFVADLALSLLETRRAPEAGVAKCRYVLNGCEVVLPADHAGLARTGARPPHPAGVRAAVADCESVTLAATQAFYESQADGPEASFSKLVLTALRGKSSHQDAAVLQPCNVIMEKTVSPELLEGEPSYRYLVKTDAVAARVIPSTLDLLLALSARYAEACTAAGASDAASTYTGLLVERLTVAVGNARQKVMAEVDVHRLVGDCLSGRATVDAKFEAEAEASAWLPRYNHLAPLVQPWAFTFLWKENVSRQYSIRSEQRLNVSLCPEQLRALRDLAREYQGAAPEPQAAPQTTPRSAQTTPVGPSEDWHFDVHNQTGSKLYFWTHRDATRMRPLLEEERVRVYSGDRIPIIGIQLDSGYEPITGLAIKRQQACDILEMVPGGGGPAIPIVVHNVVDEKRKRSTLVLSSPLCVHNHTSHDLFLGFASTRNGFARDSGALVPGAGLHAPLASLLGGELTLGLSENGGDAGSRSIPLAIAYEEELQTTVTFAGPAAKASPRKHKPHPSGEGAVTLAVYVTCTNQMIGKSGKTHNLFNIFLMPPVVFFNHLPPPYRLQVSIVNRKGKKVAPPAPQIPGGPPRRSLDESPQTTPRSFQCEASPRKAFVASGESCDFYSKDLSSSSLWATVRVEDPATGRRYVSVRPVCLFTPGKGSQRAAEDRERVKVLLSEEQADGTIDFDPSSVLPIAATAVLLKNSHSSLQVKLYVPYLLSNFTAHGIRVKDGAQGGAKYRPLPSMLPAGQAGPGPLLFYSDTCKLMLQSDHHAPQVLELTSIGLSTTILLKRTAAKAASRLVKVHDAARLTPAEALHDVSLTVSKEMGSGVLEDTCLVTLAPSFVVANHSPLALQIRQPGSPMKVALSGQTVALDDLRAGAAPKRPSKAGAPPSASVRIVDIDKHHKIGKCTWSEPFRLDQPGTQYVVVPRKAARLPYSKAKQFDRCFAFLKLHSYFVGASIVTKVFHVAPDKLPFRIENDCEHVHLSFRQKGSSIDFQLPCGRRTWFTFPSPSCDAKRLEMKFDMTPQIQRSEDLLDSEVQCADAVARELDFSVMGTLAPVRFTGVRSRYSVRSSRKAQTARPFEPSGGAGSQRSAKGSVTRVLSSLGRFVDTNLASRASSARSGGFGGRGGGEADPALPVIRVQVVAETRPGQGPVRVLRLTDRPETSSATEEREAEQYLQRRLRSGRDQVAQIDRIISSNSLAGFGLGSGRPSPAASPGRERAAAAAASASLQELVRECQRVEEELKGRYRVLSMMGEFPSPSRPGVSSAKELSVSHSFERIIEGRQKPAGTGAGAPPGLIPKLDVHVIELQGAAGLPGRDAEQGLKAYVKLRADSSAMSFVTGPASDRRHLAWNETFQFQRLPADDKIHLELYDRNLLTADALLGRASLSLQDLDLGESATPRFAWCAFEPEGAGEAGAGAREVTPVLRVKVQCSPAAGGGRASPRAAGGEALFQVDVHSVGLSLSDDIGQVYHGNQVGMQELFHIFLGDVNIRARRSATDEQIQLAVRALQIDNQMDCAIPVICNSLADRGGPWLELTTDRAVTGGGGLHFRHFSVLTREVDLVFEESFLDILTHVVAHRLEQDEVREGFAAFLPNPVAEAARTVSSAGPQGQVCFDALTIHPVKANITIIPSPRSFCYQSLEMTQFWPQWLAAGPADLRRTRKLCPVLISHARRFREESGLPFLSLQLATLRLDAVSFEHLIAGEGEALSRVFFQYRQQLLREVYQMIGSLDALGSPKEALHAFGAGWVKLFREPFSRAGAQGLGRGFLIGMGSLLQHTAHGLALFSSVASGSAAKGLRYLADNEYQWERYAEALRKVKVLQKMRSSRHPKSVALRLGLKDGCQELGRAILSGAKGVVVHPLHGARAGEGALGLAKGVGKGASGVVLCPIAGLLQLVSKTSDGIQQATNVRHERPIARVKQPNRADHAIVSMNHVSALSAQQQPKVKVLWICKRLEPEEAAGVLRALHRRFPARMAAADTRGEGWQVNKFRYVKTAERLIACRLSEAGAWALKWAVELKHVLSVEAKFESVAIGYVAKGPAAPARGGADQRVAGGGGGAGGAGAGPALARALRRVKPQLSVKTQVIWCPTRDLQAELIGAMGGGAA